MTTVQLTEPVTMSGITYDKLELRRLKVRDRLAVERSNKAEAEKGIAMIKLHSYLNTP